MIINTCQNILTPAVFKTVKQTVFGGEVPWYATMTDYYNQLDPNKYSHSWAHMAVTDGKPVSILGDTLLMAALMAFDKVGIQPKEILRIRLGLHSISPQSYIGGPHVDWNFPHKVALLYLNNSDGDTRLYKERFDPRSSLNNYEYFQQTYGGRATVSDSSTPEENKMIWFDGLHYHSSSSPTTVAKRIVVNINYTED